LIKSINRWLSCLIEEDEDVFYDGTTCCPS